MKFILAFALIGFVAAYTDVEYQSAFTSWMQANSRAYSSEEFSSRFEVFKANMDFVQAWNAEPSHTHEVELNKFADLSNEEYQSIYLGYKRQIPAVPELNEAPTPTGVNVDWRTKGYVTGVKDQGQCGSCWSFSATGSSEAAHFRATGNLVSLSEQNLMDCSTAYGNGGCNGGQMVGAYKYIIANKGLDTEASYPYTAKNGQCHFSSSNIGATLSTYKQVASGSESDLVNAINVQPVSVAIDASKNSFQLYKSGVYYEPSCSSSRLDHGVLAVGYGTDDASGNAYYIVKNSWGAGWGQAGYIQMSRNRNNNCGIATDASYPTA